MTDPESHERYFWERVALSAIGVILETEANSTEEEAAGIAALCADAMLVAWRARFSQAAAMTSVDFEDHDG